MPLSKPVRLDPYQRIVNVGWGGVDILVLEFSYRAQRPAAGVYAAGPAVHVRDL